MASFIRTNKLYMKRENLLNTNMFILTSPKIVKPIDYNSYITTLVHRKDKTIVGFKDPNLLSIINDKAVDPYFLSNITVQDIMYVIDKDQLSLSLIAKYSPLHTVTTVYIDHSDLIAKSKIIPVLLNSYIFDV